MPGPTATDRYTGLFSSEANGEIQPDLEQNEDILALIEYARELEANEVLEEPEETDEEEGSPWYERLSIGWWPESKTNLDPSTSGSDFETEHSSEFGIRFKPFEDRHLQVHEDSDDEGFHHYQLRVLGVDASSQLSLGQIHDDDGTRYGLQGNIGAGATMLQYDNSWNSGENAVSPITVNVDATAVSAEARAEGEVTFNFAEGEAVASGELKLDATLLELVFGAQRTIIPARNIDATCNAHPWLGSLPYIDELCEAVSTDEYDFGITLGIEGGPSVGAGGRIHGEASLQNGRTRFGAGVKGQLGLGASMNGEMEVGHFPRD